MLARPSEAGLEFGLAVTPSGCLPQGASLPAAMPSERDRGLSGTQLIGLGVFLAAAFVVPLIAGLMIDQVAHTTPGGLLGGLVVGIAAAAFGLRAQMRRYL
ncbi:MAG: hypothetical protein ABR950_06305 [Candidatus Dormibacteria bacterium]